MTELEKLRAEAFDIRIRFKSGAITVGEAKEMLKPYEKAFNEHSKASAPPGIRPQKFSVMMFLKMKV